ncbi:MAG: hypothetical protein JST12_02865 [Armatimonadetes bacterium]|nr:hypothetical protein [Armatimonadota bacterium]
MQKSYVWRDPKQDRSVAVRVTFPREGTHLPIIVLSHDIIGSEDSMSPLVDYWADHGYAVFQPRHRDSFLNLPPGARPIPPMKRQMPDYRSRVRDCEFIYEVCRGIKKWIPELNGRLDAKRIVQAGHSFGAHTTQMLGGMLVQKKNLSSPIPTAFCSISPQGAGGRDAQDWKSFHRPLMVVGGTKDFTPVDTEEVKAHPEARQEPFKLSPAGDKFLVWIQDASHNFGGITGDFSWPGAGRPNSLHVRIVQESTLAFFDAYTKDDQRQMRWLKSHLLAAETKGEAVITFR